MNVKDHPALVELHASFVLHDDHTRQKIQTWIDRWISVNVIESILSEDDMKSVDQDVLFDQMFTRLSKMALAKKAAANAHKMNDGSFHFVMKIHALNKEPNRILKAVP